VAEICCKRVVYTKTGENYNLSLDNVATSDITLHLTLVYPLAFDICYSLEHFYNGISSLLTLFLYFWMHSLLQSSSGWLRFSSFHSVCVHVRERDISHPPVFHSFFSFISPILSYFHLSFYIFFTSYPLWFRSKQPMIENLHFCAI
jgi:hypothetical protein